MLFSNYRTIFFTEFAQRGFKAINDQAVKLEPRDQGPSPYLDYAGNYRETLQATPSPQPSPQIFLPISPSSSPFGGNILQNSLLTPRIATMTNNFQHQTQTNQIYTPNIQTTTASPFANGNNSMWNNLNGNDPSANRAFGNNNNNDNNMPVTTSSIFNQPLTPTPIITQNFNTFNEPPMANSSVLIDLDHQYLIENLSGDLQCLSFSDFAMDSFSKTGDKSSNNGNIQHK